MIGKGEENRRREDKIRRRGGKGEERKIDQMGRR